MLRIYPGIHHLFKPDGKSTGLYKQDNEPTSAKLIKLTDREVPSLTWPWFKLCRTKHWQS